MTSIKCVTTLIALAFLATSARAEVSESPDPLFQANDPLRVYLSGPFSTLIKERSKEDYLPGTISYENDDGTPVPLDVQIRTRGHNRHQNCKYPPVLLNFKKKQTRGTIFEGQNKLKLVIPCKYSSRYEQHVLREYLTYRIFNAVTNLSFRARLLQVSFENIEKDKEPEVRYAFLIEHKKRLADRYGMEELKIERAKVKDIAPDRLNLTSVFQYLIGNTDFSPVAGPPGDNCCHNYVLFNREDTDLILPIPYDFDQSGFVDAPYASPAPQFKIRSVRTRLYRGRCANNAYMDQSLQRFKEKRPEIYALINEQEGLTDGTRKALTKYMDAFYKLINDPEDVERYLLDKCI